MKDFYQIEASFDTRMRQSIIATVWLYMVGCPIGSWTLSYLKFLQAVRWSKWQDALTDYRFVIP